MTVTVYLKVKRNRAMILPDTWPAFVNAYPTRICGWIVNGTKVAAGYLENNVVDNDNNPRTDVSRYVDV